MRTGPVCDYDGSMNLHLPNPLDDRRIDADEARVEWFDENYPEWRDAGRFIDYADVHDPETNVVWGYGGDHRVLILGAYA